MQPAKAVAGTPKIPGFLHRMELIEGTGVQDYAAAPGGRLVRLLGTGRALEGAVPASGGPKMAHRTARSDFITADFSFIVVSGVNKDEIGVYEFVRQR